MKYLAPLLAAFCLLAGITAALTSGTWICPITGQAVDIDVHQGRDGKTYVTVTHGGESVTVEGVPDTRGGVAEFPPTSVGGASFRARMPSGTAQCSEADEGRPWFNMPRVTPKKGSSAATGDGEGTLPMTGA